MAAITENVGEFFGAALDANGVATANVKDGQVFMFSREMLEKFLNGNPDAKEFVIFVKRQTSS
jgi:hypothetical protein